jgi:hypothetical protein
MIDGMRLTSLIDAKPTGAKMQNFIVRPELKGDPSRIQYLKLHALLCTQGFLPTADGMELPHATYYGSSDKTTADLSSELTTLIRREIQYDVIVAVAQVNSVSVNGNVGSFSFAAQLAEYAMLNAVSAFTGVVPSK